MLNKTVIESKENSKIKLISSLKTKKYRDKHNLMIIEGFRAVTQLIDSEVDLEILVFSETSLNEIKSYEEIYEKNKEISIIVKDSIFNQLSDTVNTQGIIAITKIPKYSKDMFNQKSKARILLFDKIQDPGNAGTLIRTADAAGFDAIFVTKGTVDLYSPKVSRSAMGANLYIPIIEVEESDLIKFKENEFKILATALDESALTYDKVNYEDKCMIVLGNEANGVSNTILELANERIYIPIYGKAESLNVSIAGAIVMYKSLEK